MKFFMWVTYNFFIPDRFVKAHAQPGKRIYALHMFIEDMCEQLVGTVCSTQTEFDRRVSNVDSDEVRPKRDAHHDVEKPEHATGNNRCRVRRMKNLKAKKANPDTRDKDLSKRCKSMYWCRLCEEFLCIGVPNTNCWYDYHQKQNTGI